MGIITGLRGALTGIGLIGSLVAGLALQAGPARAQDARWADVTRVTGVTLYEPASLVDFAAGYVQSQHAEVTPEGLAAAVERLYHEDGYFLARVEAGQDEMTGLPVLMVDEGGVNRLAVLGVENRMAQRIASYLRPILDGQPVRLEAFERAISLAGDLSGVQIRSEFRTDAATGEPVLQVHAQAIRSRVYALLDNTPRVGAANAYLTGEVYSLLTPGDMARVILGGTTDQDSGRSGVNVAGYYRLQVGDRGTYAEVFAANTIFGRDLSGTLTDSRHQRGLSLIGLVGHPFIRNFHEFFYGFVEFDFTEIDYGQAGVRNEASRAVRGSLYYSRTDESFGSLRGGMTASLGRTERSWNPNVAESFFHLRGAVGAVLPLGDPGQGFALQMRAAGQIASGTLPETERFYLGDRERLRGYTVATVTGDTGALTTLDLSRYLNVGSRFVQAVVPSIFFDAGVVYRGRDYSVVPKQGRAGRIGASSLVLASAGVAARIFLADGFVLSGWVGMPLVDDGRGATHSPGAYVRLTKAW